MPRHRGKGVSRDITGQGGLPAQLWLLQSQPERCAVTGVLPGHQLSVLLSTTGNEPLTDRAVAGDVADLVIAETAELDSIRIRSEITRIDGPNIYLKVIPSNRHLLTEVSRRLRGGKSSWSDTFPSFDPGLREPIYRVIREAVLSYLSARFAIFSGDVEEALFKAAGANRNPHYQSDCLQSISLLKHKRTIYEDQLITGIGQMVKQLLLQNQVPVDAEHSAGDDTGGELTLLSKDDFEDWLELNKVARRVSDSCHKELDWLTQRCSVVCGMTIDPGRLPFGPAWIARHFGECTGALLFPDSVRPVIYGVFESSLLSDYRNLVRKLNDALIEYEVLPNLEGQASKPRVRKGPVRLVSNQPATATAGTASEVHPAYEPGALYESARSLMRMRTDAGGVEDSANVTTLKQPQQYFSMEQVVDVLSQLQDELPSLLEHPYDEGIRGYLNEALNKASGGQSRSISDDTSDNIQLIENVFTTIIENAQVAEEAKPILRQLEVPMLKAALMDEEFFSEENHPARRSLNLLARLCRRTDYDNTVVKRKVAEIADQIAQGIDRYPEIFEQVQVDLEELTERQRRAHERNAQRIARTLEGQQKLTRARHQVEEHLYASYGQRPIAKVLVDLLDNGWRNLMTHVALRNGVNSPQWHECVESFDELYNLLAPQQKPASNPDEKQSLTRFIEQQAETLGTGPFEYKKVIHHLDRILSGTEAIEYLDSYPDLRDVEESGEHFDLDLKRWLDRTRSLEVGDWLDEIGNSNGDGAIRLAWIADDRERFVFVDEQGHEVYDWSALELAARMRDGLQRVEDPTTTSAVDEGLYRTVHDLYNELSHKACHDRLTNLINRQEFEHQLAGYIREAQAENEEHALIAIDLDQFRLINQYHGHHAGDELLKGVAYLLKLKTPANSVIGRIDSNEFAVLVPGCGHDKGMALAESLRTAVEQYRFRWEDIAQPVTASLGLLTVDRHSSSVVATFKQLAIVTEKAKQAGRNCVRTLEESAEETRRQDEMLAWVTGLGTILEENRLKLRCQLIQPVSRRCQGDVHHEILLGVLDHEGKLTPPGDLIAAAERYNRMDAIDRWVIHTLMEWCRGNPDKVDQLGKLSINLSGNSVNNDQFLLFLLDEVDRAPVPGDHICFELTETATIANLPKAADFINTVKSRGCKFALDDFGTGLSSFEYLKKLPVDYLKIDGIFVRELANNEDDRAMVRAINQVAHLLGKASMAEYVENETILNHLRKMGVDYAQGWGVAKPFLLDDL